VKTREKVARWRQNLQELQTTWARELADELLTIDSEEESIEGLDVDRYMTGQPSQHSAQVTGEVERDIDPRLLIALTSAAGIVRRAGYQNTGDCLEILRGILNPEEEKKDERPPSTPSL
jgi:hypothetical protein